MSRGQTLDHAPTALCLLLLTALGCSQADILSCGTGDRLAASGDLFCVYPTGVGECPARVSERLEVGASAVCSSGALTTVDDLPRRSVPDSPARAEARWTDRSPTPRRSTAGRWWMVA